MYIVKKFSFLKSRKTVKLTVFLDFKQLNFLTIYSVKFKAQLCMRCNLYVGFYWSHHSR